MLGKAYLRVGKSSIEALVSVWAMAEILRFVSTIGSPCIKHPTKIASPIIDFLEGATVDCLIYVDPRQWNIDMVDGIFIPEEAKLIKKIPVSNRRLGFFVLASLQ